MKEFHISREVRDRYQFDRALFTLTGNVVFANLAASREFAHRMNQARDAEDDPARAVHPGALFAMGLIDEASHAVVEFYRRQVDPKAMTDALPWFEARIGKPAMDRALLGFVEQFPTINVYRGEQSGKEWLEGTSDGVPHRAVALEEMILLWLANANPAFRPFSELFDDTSLANETPYREITAQLHPYFSTRPPLDEEHGNLIDALRAPALASPDSLSGQLAYVRKRWARYLGDALEKLLLAMDVLKEEEIAIWMRFNPPSESTMRRRRGNAWDPESVRGQVPSYADAAQEYEHFSADVEWMPTTVLIAKSTYVWLEQLSKQYGRPIERLDQIPDEELATFSRRGLNSLWLIGIWERSRASQTIKQLCGNKDAVASAYSLYDYSISADLGGEAAYRNLRDRAYRHGIRLASDMVPNHMGIDSNWVIEHPEWFLSRPDSPYPAYRFDGPDLSHDGRVELKIEDHYYEQTDAAVVFRRRDKWTGDTRYVYHGNDGTSFPWNDTAQIDYLNPAAREQVIQTILHVARLFPIIRFDAAMTLAKRHIERLWYPVPGTGGAIPSRAEYSMSKAQFDALMPHEFWREVVDRVAQEVPGTLLLAEAFWLMEGYFVRTLGMHRVYNSAFMNMMRDEENAKYRSVIKNTLEFDPDILKRYVNFMSNPDERTAVDQFGTGDKCFGVATVMSTLPGLPMFGHGQIEGFTEKYGMEFRRPRYDERPDHWLVERHEREVAPLLHRRALFAESHNFLLYDFFRPEGSVDENVFAYSNRLGDQRALVLYHNRYATTTGTIHQSAAYADKGAGQLRQRSIGEALGLPNDDGVILAYRDVLCGLEYLRRSSDVVRKGFSVELHAYKCHVFVDWRELRPDRHYPWDRLCDSLRGRGVPNLDEALLNLELEPVHDAVAALLSPELVRRFAEAAADPHALDERRQRLPDPAISELLRMLRDASLRFLGEAHAAHVRKSGAGRRGPFYAERAWSEMLQLLQAVAHVPGLEGSFSSAWSADARAVLPSASPQVTAIMIWGPALAWAALKVLASSVDPLPGENAAVDLFKELRLAEPLAQAFARLGITGEDGWRAVARVRLALAHTDLEPSAASDPGTRSATSAKAARTMVAGLPGAVWSDPDARWLLGLHEAAGKTYFNKELHEQLLWWLQLPRLVAITAPQEVVPQPVAAGVTTGDGSATSAKPQPAKPQPATLKPAVKRAATAESNTAVDAEVRQIEAAVKAGLAQAAASGYVEEQLPGAKKSPPQGPEQGPEPAVEAVSAGTGKAEKSKPSGD